MADIRQNVEGKFSQVKGARLSLMLDYIKECLNQIVLLQIYLEHFEIWWIENCHHCSFSAWNVSVCLQELSEYDVATYFMYVWRHKGNQLWEDIESMNLKFNKLWLSPSCDNLVSLNLRWINVNEKCFHEILLDYGVVSVDIERILADCEDLCP